MAQASREWFEKDYYKVLGVAEDATERDIQRAYRKLAKQFHPDANPGDKSAEERFKRISSAFDLLGDADKRKKFDAGEIDADGHEVFRGVSGGGPFGQGGGFRGGDAENIDLGDIL